ncbi:MAG: type II secretion system F family protein [Nitrospiraceae bacterium]|nr:MAG: type II secretion system F family protein [Nitrospiraceae bacterium]
MELIIGIGIFLTVILLAEGIYYFAKTGMKPEQKKVKKRLRTLLAGGFRGEEIDIAKKRLLSEVPWFNRMLLTFPFLDKLERLLEQANIRYPVGYYLLLTLLFAACGYLAGTLLTVNFLIAALLACVFSTMPSLYIYYRKSRRMSKFERQLPDALDLMVRALKAGHAFSSGIRMVADEFDDPVGAEFAKTMDEINFGVGVSEALINLTNRVDCPDLQYFVISVIVQKETGGNLAETLEKISHLIRERFRFQGRVQVLSSEGKLSAFVLISLPFLITFYMLLVNPNFIEPLLNDAIGKMLIAGAFVMMLIGSFIMKRMITIKV